MPEDIFNTEPSLNQDSIDQDTNLNQDVDLSQGTKLDQDDNLFSSEENESLEKELLERRKLSHDKLTEALNEAAAAISENQADFGLDSDMVIGGNIAGNAIEPGSLKFSYLKGSLLPPDSDGNKVFSGATFENLNMVTLMDTNNIARQNYTGNSEDVPFYGVYKVEGVYNNHPFHMVVSRDLVHDGRDVWQGFLDDFKKACDNGKGKEFLADSKLQFGFYDGAKADIKPEAFLNVIAMQSKLALTESLCANELNKINEDVSYTPEKGVTKEALELIVDRINKTKKALGQTTEPNELFTLPNTSSVNLDYQKVNLAELCQKAAVEGNPATDKQIKYLANNFDGLSPAYKKLLNKEELLKGKSPAYLDFVAASDAIRGISARLKLKAYLPSNDKLWQNMDTRRAEELAKSFKGKATLAQQEFFEKRGIDSEKAKSMSFFAAKEIMENSKPTGKLKAFVATLVDIKDAALLTCRAAKELIRKNLATFNMHLPEPVSPPVYYHAVKEGRIKPGEKYTKAMWQADCQKMPALDEQKAYIERHNLGFALKAAENTAGKGSFAAESAALYAKVITDHKLWILENGKSPVQENEKDFLMAHNVDMQGIDNRAKARTAMLSCAYQDRIIGKTAVKFINAHPDMELPKDYLEAVKNQKELSADDISRLRKEVTSLCVDTLKADREYAIRTTTLSPAKSLYDVARQAANEHLSQNGSLDGCEEDIAKKLACANFIVTPYMRGEVAKHLNTETDKVSDANVYAHIMVSVLPKGVKNYKALVADNSKLCERAVLARDKEIQKESIKAEAKSAQKEQSKADQSRQGAER